MLSPSATPPCFVVINIEHDQIMSIDLCTSFKNKNKGEGVNSLPL